MVTEQVADYAFEQARTLYHTADVWAVTAYLDALAEVDRDLYLVVFERLLDYAAAEIARGRGG